MKKLILIVTAALIVGLLCFSAQAQTPGEDALRMHLQLDDLNTEDASGNGNDGIPYASMATSMDRHGNPDGAMYFDGDRDWLEVPQDGIDFDSFTLSIWINKDPNQPGAAFAVHFPYKTHLRVEPASSAAPDRLEVGATLIYDFPSSEWVHVATTYDAEAGLQKLYINGVLRDISPYIPQTAPDTLHVGGFWKNNNFFKGDVDDVMLFDRPLDIAEISELAEIDYEEPEETIPVSQCFAINEEECPEEECLEPFAMSEEECLGYCPEVEACPEMPEMPDCEESTEILNSRVKKAKLHFKKHGTDVHVHLKSADVPEGLIEGAVTVQLRFLQGDDVVEFTGEVELDEHGQNLMDKKSKQKKEKRNKGKKGGSCKYKK